MSMSSSSSSSNSKPKRGHAWRAAGPRPRPLSLPTSAAARPSKKPRVIRDGGGHPPGPVIIYERTPKAVHVRPEEFMAVVQRLTGQHQQLAAPAMIPPAKEETATAAADHLVPALGQQEAPLLQNCLPGLPTPGPASDGFLPSPGIFLFSPATMQAIHEMIS